MNRDPHRQEFVPAPHSQLYINFTDPEVNYLSARLIFFVGVEELRLHNMKLSSF